MNAEGITLQAILDYAAMRENALMTEATIDNVFSLYEIRERARLKRRAAMCRSFIDTVQFGDLGDDEADREAARQQELIPK